MNTLFVRPLVCPSVRVSVCLSVCPPVCLSVRLSVRLSVCRSVCVSVCPSENCAHTCAGVCVCECVCVRVCVCVWLSSRYSGRGKNHDLAVFEVLPLLTNNFNNVNDYPQEQGRTQCKTSKLHLPNINRLRGPKWGLFCSFWPVPLVSTFA